MMFLMWCAGEPEVYPKFSEDPKFRLVFNSGNVAVFQVVK